MTREVEQEEIVTASIVEELANAFANRALGRIQERIHSIEPADLFIFEQLSELAHIRFGREETGKASIGVTSCGNEQC